MARSAGTVRSKSPSGSRPKKKVTRRTNAERSESTRERVITAAIQLLHARGYSGATTLAIHEAAGISLGALQHQFPSKAKLMAAVLERFGAYHFACYEEAIRVASDPLDCINRMFDVSGAILQDPEFASGLEILLAKRNDPELAEELKPLILHWNGKLRRVLDKIATDAGVGDPVWNNRTLTLNNAVAHGLAAELLIGSDRTTVIGAYALWRELIMDFLTRNVKSRRNAGKA